MRVKEDASQFVLMGKMNVYSIKMQIWNINSDLLLCWLHIVIIQNLINWISLLELVKGARVACLQIQINVRYSAARDKRILNMAGQELSETRPFHTLPPLLPVFRLTSETLLCTNHSHSLPPSFVSPFSLPLLVKFYSGLNLVLVWSRIHRHPSNTSLSPSVNLSDPHHVPLCVSVLPPGPQAQLNS